MDIKLLRRNETFPSDLTSVSAKELCALSSRVYSQLDCDHPAPGAWGQYYELLHEFEVREAAREDVPVLGTVG